MFSIEFTEEHAKKAWAWYLEHNRHVNKLANNARSEFPPSGSDTYQPGLWKAESWRWFLKRYNRDVKI